MLLTIGMMVKNEEKHLKECLKSLQPLLENLDAELVIVDTGSTDNTINIAQQFTDRLYFHEWNNDFSEMRNITINYAKGDWFFVIDGDEVLENVDEIIEFFKSGEYKKYNSGSMILKNFINSTDLDKYGLCDTIRLFKNDGIFKYTGTVHNQPTYKEPTKKVLSTIQHYGYLSDDIELMEKKFIRTSTILKRELEKDPKNIYYRYQLAVSYHMHSDFSDSLEEISNVYKQLNEKNKKNYKYVLNEYANILISNGKFKQCEELCKKELKLTDKEERYKVDLVYYLAKCQCIQGDYNNSLINYKKYLKLLDKLESGKLPLDLTVKVLSSSNRYGVYNDIAVIEYSNKNYKAVIDNILKIKEEKYLKNLLNNLINSFIKLEDFNGLKRIYEDKILNLSDDLARIFQLNLENIILELNSDKIKEKIEILFSTGDKSSSYVCLNKLRRGTEPIEKESIYNKLASNIDFVKEYNYYGDLIYIGIKNNYNIVQIIRKMEYDKVIEYLDYCDKKYNDFSEVLLSFIERDNIYEDDFIENRVKVIICKALLILDRIKEEDYKNIFKTYINNGMQLIKKVYSRYILDNEMVLEIRNDEHKFFMYMIKAEENKSINEKKYIRYLRYALKSYPNMRKGIENIINEITKKIDKKSDEMNKLKDMLIQNVNILISNRNYTEALSIIGEFEKIIKNDADILLLKSDIMLRI